MIVYFDTVRRKRPVREGGEVIVLNWSNKTIISKLPIFPTDPDIDRDPNPRGNSRGGKGIAISRDEVFVGTYHSILVFTPELALKRKTTNPLFVNVHEICLAESNLWVSSTAVDCAILVDPAGETLKCWCPGEEPTLQRRFGLPPLSIDRSVDNRLLHLHEQPSSRPGHTHLNCVTRHGTKTFVLMNKLGIFAQIEPDFNIVLENHEIRGTHSAKVTDEGDQVFLCGSFDKTVASYCLRTGHLLQKLSLSRFSEIKSLQRKAPDEPFNRSIFVRGLQLVKPNRILVGISPASILEIDWEKQELVDFFQYSSDVGDAIHGLACLALTDRDLSP